jgi:hypothetical protein
MNTVAEAVAGKPATPVFILDLATRIPRSAVSRMKRRACVQTRLHPAFLAETWCSSLFQF